ncbi:helix-turn-helix domain-containing protein [Streptomyces sp. NPDC015144]|uniref:helix-turn-helix domain-containing protein n=1 Tax=Streptomyces sp. NPDC015144 TaxID=3364944 RepID=UPI0036FD1EC2
MPKRKSESADSNARSMLYTTLKRLREESGKSLQDLQDETTYDRGYLHKLETGARLGSPEVMAALDRVYGTRTQLQQLWTLASDQAFGDRYAKFMDLERRASVQYTYSSGVIPGLLQTEGYATEVLGLGRRDRDDVNLLDDVAARMSRQDMLRGGGAPHFRALIDEAAFQRIAADPKVWIDQLESLLDWMEQPNIAIQVVPFAAGMHSLLGGSLTVLWLPDGKSVVYSESSTGGDLIEEPGRVEALRLSYDLLRDKALSPEQSAEFIANLIKEHKACTPDPT